MVLAWAQLVWPAVLVALSLAARRLAAWLWLGIAANAIARLGRPLPGRGLLR
jgi:hypothetical protein